MEQGIVSQVGTHFSSSLKEEEKSVLVAKPGWHGGRVIDLMPNRCFHRETRGKISKNQKSNTFSRTMFNVERFA